MKKRTIMIIGIGICTGYMYVLSIHNYGFLKGVGIITSLVVIGWYLALALNKIINLGKD